MSTCCVAGLPCAGFDVLVAGDGEQGVATSWPPPNSSRPRTSLMDLSLPVLDGWEATRRLKAAVETGSIPVIALSAHAMEGVSAPGRWRRGLR